MGALSLRDFGLALFVGLITGAYSSIFVATPILAKWREREPKMRALRERSESQAARRSSRRASPTPPAPTARRRRERGHHRGDHDRRHRAAGRGRRPAAPGAAPQAPLTRERSAADRHGAGGA